MYFLALDLSFSLSKIIGLVFGIVVGLVIGAYIFISSKKKKIISANDEKYHEIDHENILKTDFLINNVSIYHSKARKTKRKLFFGLINIKRKVDYTSLAEKYLNIKDCEKLYTFPEELYWLVYNTAKLYYPDSSYPLFELTIDEVFVLVREIISLVSRSINSLEIANIENLKVSQIISVVSLGNKVKKYASIKAIRISINVINFIVRLQAFITPVYWIKRGTSFAAIDNIGQYFYKSLFEIIGKETSLLYSKHL